MRFLKALLLTPALPAFACIFGGTGIVVSEVATKGKNDTANAIVLQSDERVPTTRVLVSGFAQTSSSEFAIARYWR